MSYSTFRDFQVSYKNDMGVDASGRLRVSQTTSLGDYKQINDSLPLFFDQKGTGTFLYNKPIGSTTMSVTSGQYAVRESFMFHNYSSGKSQLIDLTFSNFQNEVGVTKRVGYYSSAFGATYNTQLDGFFLESSPTDYSFNVYRDGNLTISIPRNLWKDPLDGTGPSAINYDFSKFTVMGIDFLYLGGTILRAFLIVQSKTDGDKLVEFVAYRHSGYNNNIMIQSPNQKIRYEIRSTTGSGSLDAICSTVSSEGSIDKVGIFRSVHTGTSVFNADVAGTTYAVKGIRLKAAYKNISIDPTQISVLATNNDDFRWDLMINPVIAGTFTYTDISNSSAQEATGTTANTVTLGVNSISIASGYVTGNTDSVFSVDNTKRIGVDLDGVMDQLVLCITPLTSGLDIHAALTFRELL